MSDKKRKRKRNYYVASNKKQKLNTLQPGMRGVLITCNNTEKMCVREAYNLLNEYADKLFGPEQFSTENEIEEDFEAQIQKEVESLKNARTVRRFQQVNTKVKNLLFIKSQVPDPILLVQSVFEDVKESQQGKSRFIQRMIPVSETCKAFIEPIKKALLTLISNYLPNNTGDKVAYMMVYKSRNNQELLRDEVLKVLKEVVQEKKPLWMPNLKDPDLIINVNIVTSVCCLSILKDYEKFRKYNLCEVSTKNLQQKVGRALELTDKSSKGEVFQSVELNNSSEKCDLVVKLKGIPTEKNEPFQIFSKPNILSIEEHESSVSSQTAESVDVATHPSVEIF